jgi:sugar/nucleoside kinase (ribokinase family)
LQIPELLTLRGTAQRPFVVWEPFPRACTAANRSAFVEACRYVDVFSPNQIELAALFEDTQSHVFDKEKVEGHARHFTHSTKIGIILVRCGQHGSLTLTSSGEPLWLPPFYSSGAKEVVDPTGAGNTFLGGFMAGWERTKDVREASMYGNVAASFAVEQVGLPTLTRDEGDVWNGVRAVDRLAQYRSRIGLNL